MLLILDVVPAAWEMRSAKRGHGGVVLANSMTFQNPSNLFLFGYATTANGVVKSRHVLLCM